MLFKGVFTMRIALCTDSFLPIIDGVGRVCHEYATRLPKRGHECYVITPMQETGFRGNLPFEIVDFAGLKTPLASQYKSGVATMDPHYLERISHIRPDIIHAHTPGAAGMEAIRLAEKWGVPLIGTFHSKYYDDFRRYTKSELLSNIGVRFVVNFFERCDEVWTVSWNAAETLRSYGYMGAIKIFRNGCSLRQPDPSFEKAAREKYHLSDAPILLYAGQIDRKKNLGRIIETASVLRKKGRDFQLVFAGKGADEEALREYAKEKDAGEIIFTGHISDVSLLDGLYMAASLFIFPSLYDTAGLVIGEAAVMGTPSVVVRTSAPAEVIKNGHNGFIAIDQPNSIAEAIEKFLFTMNEEERQQIRKNAREEIPLGWDAIMDEVESRYKKLARCP